MDDLIIRLTLKDDSCEKLSKDEIIEKINNLLELYAWRVLHFGSVENMAKALTEETLLIGACDKWKGLGFRLEDILPK